MTDRPTGDRPDDYDARFADIVSRWDDPSTGSAPDRAAAAGSTGTDSDVSSTAPSSGPAPERSFDDPAPWRVHEPPEDEEEGYVPPPPRPLPSVYTDWPFYVALIGLVAGPLWLIYLAMFASTEHSLMWMAGGLAVAGFATLVLRQPRDREDDDGDDGARV